MKFFARSVLILLALYGLVFAIGDTYLARVGVPLWGAILFAILIVGVQYLAGPWLVETVVEIHWDDLYPALPTRNREFIEKLCADRGLKVPRIGVIPSGTPNAFSYGHTPGDSRVVVTRGLLDVLTVDEANSVLAHEIGHIEHWDFVVMTIAALAPLLLYQIYAFTRHISNLRALAYGAYLCYWVSQFVVLLLNRTREYFADHYAAEVTHTPEALSSALIKIAYGMVKADGEYKQALSRKTVDAQMRREYRLAGIDGSHGYCEPALRSRSCPSGSRRGQCGCCDALGLSQSLGSILRIELDPSTNCSQSARPERTGGAISPSSSISAARRSASALGYVSD